MRGLILSLIRFSAAILTAAVIVIPAVALAGWSVWYLFRCASVLTAPDVPVRFSYVGQGGNVVLTADRYAVDPLHLSAFATGIRVRDDHGYEYAAVDRLFVRYDRPRVFVDVSGGTARVERIRETYFSFQNALPKPSETKEESPYVVTADHVRIRYTDAWRSPILSREVTIRDFRIEGVGGRFELSAVLSPAGVGEIPLRIARQDSGILRIDARFDRTITMPLVPHVERWVDTSALKEFRPYGAESIWLTGPVTVEIPAKGQPVIAANLHGSARALQVGKWVHSGNIEFIAQIRNRSAVTDFNLNEPGRTVQFAGALSFEKQFSISGNVTATMGSRRDLWGPLAAILPNQAGYSGAKFDGRAFYAGNRYGVVGRLTANALNWGPQRLLKPSLSVALDERQVTASGIKVAWQGQSFAGGVQYVFRSGRLAGFATAPSVSLEEFGSEFGVKNVSGSAKLQAILSGTLRKPQVRLAATGVAQYDASDREPIYLGNFAARAELDDNVLNLTRVTVQGPHGAASGVGSYALKNHNFNLSVVGGGIEIAAFQPDLAGLGFVEGTLSGTTKQYQYQGSIDVYAAKYADHDFPIITGRITGDQSHADADQIVALVGASRAKGSIGLDFSTKALKGALSADRITLSDWLGEEFAGVASAHDIQVSGTLEEPQLDAKIEARDFLAFDTQIDDLVAQIQVDRHGFRLQSGDARLGNGHATGSGSYRFDDGSGSATATLTSLPLAGMRVPGVDVHFMGEISGDARATFDRSGLKEGSIKGRLLDLGANGQQIGDGQLAVDVKDRRWEGSAAIGEVDPPSYVRINNAVYTESDKHIEAHFEALGLPLEEVIRGFAPNPRDFQETPRYLVQTTKGKIAVDASLTGNLDQPELSVKSILLDDLSVGDRAAGKIEASGTWSKGNWILQALNWKNEDTALSANGFIHEGGDLKVEGELSNFDLTWLSLIAPSTASMLGKADVSFALSGLTDNPDGIGSIGVKDLGYLGSDGKLQNVPINASLDTIELKNKSISALGAFSYQDFSGILQATVPFSALASPPDHAGPPVHAQIELKERNLSEFTSVMTWMDPKKTQGKLGGKIEYTGFPDDHRIAGAVAIRDATLAANGIDTYLQDLQAKLELTGSKILVTGAATSSAGGDIRLDSEVGLPDSFEGLKSVSDLLQLTTLNGTIQASRFEVAQNPNDRNSRIEGAIQGELRLGGNLLEPTISGVPGEPLVLTNVNAIIPSEFAAQPDRGPSLINPHFIGVRAVTKQPANIRTSSASLALSAEGEMNGTLQYPNLQSLMNVVSGEFRLPTTKVSIEPGGTLRFSYVGTVSSEPTARLEANLQGSTYVSALRLSDVIDRYRVDLFITGNILEENGLVIRASSDPPGLTQDQILGLIGQTSLLESLTNTALNRQFGAGLSTAIYGLALPTLLNPLTSSIASNLQLDYLNIEYNTFDQISVVAAKSLGHGFTLYGRRQLSPPTTGKQKYELKLTYRIPFKKGELSRVALGIGFDQDRPWKLTLDYGRRF